MELKKCPKCGEESPTEAVMCWSCYSTFPGSNPAPIRTFPGEEELHFPKFRWWQDKAEIAVPVAVVASLISSGWWRGKTRFWVLGASLGCIAAMKATEKRAEAPTQDPRDLDSPIVRIADTVLLYALKDEATKVRVTKQEFGIDVEYKITNRWHMQMKIPGYVWKPLKNEFETRAGNGTFSFAREEVSGTFALHILIEPPKQEIVLTLQ